MDLTIRYAWTGSGPRMPIITLENATKYFNHEHGCRKALSDVNLTIKQGEFVFVVGSSGAGKSTLLQLISGQIHPEEGTVLLDNLNLGRFSLLYGNKMRQTFGYVPQEPQLIRRRTVLENLAIVARVGGLTRSKKIVEIAEKALGVVGLSGVCGKYPVELSLGESRRVELARAIINSPPVLVLDELTANLDQDNIWDVFHLLTEMNRQGTTVIMATHASMFVNIMHRRVITLVDGKVAGDVEGGRYGDITGKTAGLPNIRNRGARHWQFQKNTLQREERKNDDT